MSDAGLLAGEDDRGEGRRVACVGSSGFLDEFSVIEPRRSWVVEPGMLALKSPLSNVKLAQASLGELAALDIVSLDKLLNSCDASRTSS